MPYANKASFLEPRRIVEPLAWAGHIPFAFWLVDTLRPKLIVELGTHTGNSFCAFAQAIEAFGLDAKVFAVDHWLGDEHAGAYSEDVYEELARYVNTLYPEIAKMVRSTFDEALDRFEDNSINLLHIDGMHTYNAVKHDFISWLPKMADNGIVLLHDTAVNVRDFGVGAFLSELAANYPTVNFVHSHGLGVVALGKIPDSLKALFTGESDEAGLDAAEVFGRLGNGLLGQSHASRLATPSNIAEGQGDSIAMIGEIHSRLETLTAALVRETEIADSYRSPFASTGQAKIFLVQKILSSGYFSPRYYARQLNEAPKTDIELCMHYLKSGEAGGMRPSAEFDPIFYASTNADVVERDVGLLEHFVLFGCREGRLPKAGDINDVAALDVYEPREDMGPNETPPTTHLAPDPMADEDSK